MLDAAFCNCVGLERKGSAGEVVKVTGASWGYQLLGVYERVYNIM